MDEKSKKDRKPGVVTLAQMGQSPVTCRNCRYSHPAPFHGRKAPAEKCFKKFVGVNKDGNMARNQLRYHSPDPDYSCGYGLPPVQHRSPKAGQAPSPVSASESAAPPAPSA